MYLFIYVTVKYAQKTDCNGLNCSISLSVCDLEVVKNKQVCW